MEWERFKRLPYVFSSSMSSILQSSSLLPIILRFLIIILHFYGQHHYHLLFPDLFREMRHRVTTFRPSNDTADATGGSDVIV